MLVDTIEDGPCKNDVTIRINFCSIFCCIMKITVKLKLAYTNLDLSYSALILFCTFSLFLYKVFRLK